MSYQGKKKIFGKFVKKGLNGHKNFNTLDSKITLADSTQT